MKENDKYRWLLQNRKIIFDFIYLIYSKCLSDDDLRQQENMVSIKEFFDYE